MSKRILVIPDIHGETFWRKPVQKYIDQVDRIVFLGDYLDPYPEEGKEYLPQGLFDNLMDIIDLKRNYMDKVVLLKGNHDQHYASEMFRELACGSRCDTTNWSIYNAVFVRNQELFKLVHLEDINGIPYLFSHAGLTLNWINKVNSSIWKLADNKISVADPDIIERINELDDNDEGQELLSIIGRYRNVIGPRSGSILWADIEEHAIPDAPKAYGLNKVFQVVGHSRLNDKYDKVEFDNLVLIDSQQCFMIDEDIDEKIVSLKEYEKNLEI
jgi:hypothetical protein